LCMALSASVLSNTAKKADGTSLADIIAA
jgi:hypothetical protein